MFYQKPYDYMIMIMMYNNSLIEWHFVLEYVPVTSLAINTDDLFTQREIDPATTHTPAGSFAKYSL